MAITDNQIDQLSQEQNLEFEIDKIFLSEQKIIEKVKEDSSFNEKSQDEINKIKKQQQNIDLQSLNYVEHLLRQAGNKGKYQYILILLCGINWYIAASIICGQPYFFMPPIFLCENYQGQYIICKETDLKECKIYETNIYNSIVTQFHLYCDKRHERYKISVIFFGSVAFINLIMCLLSDFFGRKKILQIVFILGTVFTFISSIASSLVLILISFIIAGGAFYSFTIISDILLNEISSNSIGIFGTTIFLFCWALSQLSMSGFMQLLHNYQTILLYLIAIPSLVCNIIFFFIFESPRQLLLLIIYQIYIRQLYQKNDKYKAFIILQKISQINKNELQIEFLENYQSTQTEKLQFKVKIKRLFQWVGIFRYPSMIKVTFTLCYIYFTSYYGYFGSIVSLPELKGNIFLNGYFLAFSELISYISGYMLLKYFKRKKIYILTYMMLSLNCLLAILIALKDQCSSSQITDCQQPNSTEYFFCIIFSRFFLGILVIVSFMQASELFPTSVRGFGNGIVCFFGGIGGIIGSAPEEEMTFKRKNSMKILLIMSIIGIIISFFVTETFSKDLQEEIKEVRYKKMKQQILTIDSQISKKQNQQIELTQNQVNLKYIKFKEEQNDNSNNNSNSIDHLETNLNKQLVFQ